MQESKKLSYLIYVLIFLIVSIVAINSFIHDPYIGYDADGHLDYITVIGNHFPSEEESMEFFSAPLAYYLPGLVYQGCSSVAGEQKSINCKLFSGHFAQWINLVLSIGVMYFLIQITKIVRPENPFFLVSTLFLLGILTVFYKTFSQVRGEPYIAFFTVFIIFITLKIYISVEKQYWRYSFVLGILLGLLILSRQWGFFIYPAIFLTLFWGSQREKSIKTRILMVTIPFSIAAIVGGWFYLHLYFEYGTVTAFNLDSIPFSFANQPISFYRNTGLEHFLLFRSPTRKTFDNQFFPIFYSDIWGDYWGYFVFIRDRHPMFIDLGNRSQITPYLGRVNFASLLPSSLFLAGFITGAKHFLNTVRGKLLNLDKVAYSLLFLAVTISFLGYGWFVIKYPLPPKGTTIKATYMLQAFVLLPLLGADFLEYIRNKKQQIYNLIIISLGVVWLHNLPAMISRYWWWLR